MDRLKGERSIDFLAFVGKRGKGSAKVPFPFNL
jgi:hypothetical protein